MEMIKESQMETLELKETVSENRKFYLLDLAKTFYQYTAIENISESEETIEHLTERMMT